MPSISFEVIHAYPYLARYITLKLLHIQLVSYIVLQTYDYVKIDKNYELAR